MTTLYEVLGVSKTASQELIEKAYAVALEDGKGKRSPDDELIRAKALKEAYSVLSTPAKRDAYDAKLAAKRPVIYDAVPEPGFPWIRVSLVVIALIGAFYIYRVQAQKEEAARLALMAAKAKAEADKAKELAEAEEARLAQERLMARQKAEEANARLLEQARHEGQAIHRQMEQFNARTKQEIAEADRQALYAKQREEQLARARQREQDYALERALARPIPRH